MSDPFFANGEPTHEPPSQAGEMCAPELGRLMKLRDALLVLKGPLASSPTVRHQIECRLLSNEVHERILGKLAIDGPPRLSAWHSPPPLSRPKHQYKCT